nr:hypothetical protein [Pseudomonas luteola]
MKGSIANFSGGTLTHNHVLLLNVCLAGAAVLVAFYGAPNLSSRFSHLPIKGYVTDAAPPVEVADNNLALPAAMASPPAESIVSAPDITALEQMWVSDQSQEGKENDSRETERLVALKQQVQARLMSVRVSALASGGAFINGKYIRSGAPIGMQVPGIDGKPLPVIATVKGNAVVLTAGDFTQTVRFK